MKGQVGSQTDEMVSGKRTSEIDCVGHKKGEIIFSIAKGRVRLWHGGNEKMKGRELKTGQHRELEEN